MMPVAVRDGVSRAAQAEWAALPVRERLAVVRRLRHALASRPDEWVRAMDARLVRSAADTLSAEVLPLAEACRFLEREAEPLLRPQRLPTRSRPFWLGGVDVEVRREPFGVALILAPFNYPLLLPGVQAVQALAAGNAVLWKPGDGGAAVAELFARCTAEAGLPAGLFAVLDEDVAAARAAIASGVNKVALTGSAATGRRVLADLADTATPATMELSGCDAVFVREDADLDRVVAALRFGMRLNGGATCIAPKRVFVQESRAAELESRLAAVEWGEWPVRTPAARLANELVSEAVRQGARLVAGSLPLRADAFRPAVLAQADPAMRLLQEDVFAPVLALVPVRDDEDALQKAAACPYTLAATVFGAEDNARHLAARVNAGVVVVNDMIVPTADPRVPFGGRGRSGFGVTRGAEGLLAWTQPKVIAVRRGRFLPHLEPPRAGDERLFRGYLAMVHGGDWRTRWRGANELWGALRGR